jgi:hypothetical protein
MIVIPPLPGVLVGAGLLTTPCATQHAIADRFIDCLHLVATRTQTITSSRFAPRQRELSNHFGTGESAIQAFSL